MALQGKDSFSLSQFPLRNAGPVLMPFFSSLFPFVLCFDKLIILEQWLKKHKKKCGIKSLIPHLLSQIITFHTDIPG